MQWPGQCLQLCPPHCRGRGQLKWLRRESAWCHLWHIRGCQQIICWDSEASHPASFQIETLGILPVSLVKIVLQLLLSHHPFEILRWNCYLSNSSFVLYIMSHAVWSQVRWWISESLLTSDPGKQSHGGLGLKWSTKSIKSSNSHINKCFVGQWSSNNAGAGHWTMWRVGGGAP